eukprot:TRINITY_DN10971_c0_g3_i3.p1 TRINITY_DN10971_c0_g3~~TRINITY_DN10971_c0_g3_i3.p1  ORF type:complete len:667 (+),score=73.84 TRINITY_DN10971_c0_g3_i3:87-2087(+)
MPPPGLWTGEHVPSVEDALDSESLLWHASQLLGGHPQGCMCHKQGPGARPLVANPDPALPRAAPRTPPQTEAPAQAAVAVKASPLSRQPHLRPGLQPQLRPGLLPAVPPPPQARPAPPSILPRCGHDGGRRRRGRSAGGTPLGRCAPLRREPGGTGCMLVPTRRRRPDAVALAAAEDLEPAGQDTLDDRRAQRRCAVLEGIVKELTAQIECLQGEAQRAAQRASSSEQLCARLQGRLGVLEDRLARRVAPRRSSPTQMASSAFERAGGQLGDGLQLGEATGTLGLPAATRTPLAGPLRPVPVPSSPPKQRREPPLHPPSAPAASGSATAAARKPTLEGAAREPAVVAPYERTQPMAGTSSGSAVRSCATCVAPANQQLAGQAGAPAGAQRQSQSLTGLLGNLASLALTSAALALLPSAPPGPPAPPPAGQAAAVAPAAAPLSAAGLVPGLQGLVGAFWKGYKDGLASRACTRRACQHAAQGGQPGGPVPHQRVTAQRGAVQSSPEAKRAEAVRFLLSEVMVFRVAAHSPRAWAPVCRAAAAAVHWAMQCWAVAFQVEYDYVANSLRRQTGGGYGAGAGLGEIQDALADVSWLQSRLLRVDAATDVLADAKVFLMDTLSRRYLLLEEMGVELGSLHNVAAVNKLKASRSMEVIETILGTDEVVLPWT